MIVEVDMVEKKESFFSSLFRGKKEQESEKEKEILQNMLDKKERIISQLHEKLHFEKEKRKKTEVFSKQADIIQRNLESKDKKNRELLSSIQNLTLSEKKLTTLIGALEEKLENTNKEKNDVLERYDLLVKTLKKTNEENNLLKETHKSLKEEIGNLNALKIQGDQMQIVGDVFLSRDALEEMQDEISSLKEMCGGYRQELDNSKKDFQLKDSLISDLRARLKSSLSLEKEERLYKIPIELLFSSSKFSEITETLKRNNLIFIDDISEDFFNIHSESCKNYSSALKLLMDFKGGRYNWDIKTYISKGPRLSKVFSRQRKLLGYFTDNYMEFLIDLENFDFNILLNFGFSSEQIKGFEEKLSEYENFKI